MFVRAARMDVHVMHVLPARPQENEKYAGPSPARSACRRSLLSRVACSAHMRLLTHAIHTYITSIVASSFSLCLAYFEFAWPRCHRRGGEYLFVRIRLEEHANKDMQPPLRAQAIIYVFRIAGLLGL